MTVLIARIDGRIVKDLVAGDFNSFLHTLGLFMGMAIPATYTNSMVSIADIRLNIFKQNWLFPLELL